jgi:hypothetical protein
MKLGLRLGLGVAVASALIALSAPGLADTRTNVPSVWGRYDLILELDHLPKQYSCKDLWYKFRDVLLAVGAGGISEILPYDCGSGRTDQGLSPKVHVAFVVPEAASGIQVRYPDLRASSAEIHLGPGRPSTLDDSDCRLLQQMNNLLFRSIPVQVVRATWNCDGAVAGQPRYGLTLQVLKPVPRDTPKATADSGARSAQGVAMR